MVIKLSVDRRNGEEEFQAVHYKSKNVCQFYETIFTMDYFTLLTQYMTYPHQEALQNATHSSK